MIAVPMRHDDEIELGQVDAFGPGVLRKSIAVVSRVAQNALPTVLNERGIASPSASTKACRMRHRAR